MIRLRVKTNEITQEPAIIVNAENSLSFLYRGITCCTFIDCDLKRQLVIQIVSVFFVIDNTVKYDHRQNSIINLAFIMVISGEVYLGKTKLSST